MPETMGGGVAVLDYDGDGKPDLLFVSGAYWPGDPRAAAQKSSLALYRNEGSDAGGPPHFRDVTREAGPRAGLLRDGRLRRATTTTTGATTST